MRNMIPYQSYFSFENELDTNTTALAGSFFCQTSQILHIVPASLPVGTHSKHLAQLESFMAIGAQNEVSTCVAWPYIKDVRHLPQFRTEESGTKPSLTGRHPFLQSLGDHHF